jgi:excisionase family DNA binding protein
MENTTLVNARVVSERLGMARSQVYRLAKKGAIPSYLIGARRGGVRFDLHEVKEALRRPTHMQGNSAK